MIVLLQTAILENQEDHGISESLETYLGSKSVAVQLFTFNNLTSPWTLHIC